MPETPPFVAVLLYPGCIFFEIALAAETLRARYALRYYTPEGNAHAASNGAEIAASGSYATLAQAEPVALLIPGGDPRSILLPTDRAAPAIMAQAGRNVLLAGICAGNLVLAASGCLRGRRATHNYTLEHTPPDKVAATAGYWSGIDFVRADLVQDGQIITAQPWAYRQYAAAVAVSLDAITPEEASDLVSYPTRRAYGTT